VEDRAWAIAIPLGFIAGRSNTNDWPKSTHTDLSCPALSVEFIAGRAATQRHTSFAAGCKTPPPPLLPPAQCQTMAPLTGPAQSHFARFGRRREFQRGDGRPAALTVMVSLRPSSRTCPPTPADARRTVQRSGQPTDGDSQRTAGTAALGSAGPGRAHTSGGRRWPSQRGDRSCVDAGQVLRHVAQKD
jgi:hypothetical protein